ncbi:unnamed protein product [Scytosiphon promiscuus]
MVTVAVGQMTSTSSKLQNFNLCARLVKEAVEAGASILALPECFSFIGEHWTDTVKAAEPLNGPSMTRYCDLAKDHGLWLSLGGFQETVPAESVSSPRECRDHGDDQRLPETLKESGQPLPDQSEGKVFNTHVIISGSGEIKAAYRKIHLFDVDIPGGPVLMESRYTQAGKEICVCEGSPAGTLGLSTCYDLRFPEMYACLGRSSQVVLVPSAFTVPTGKAHWEVLLRARAIETQAYVVASAQVGQHNHKRASFGHSLIVDPWGKVLADAGGEDSPCIRTAEVDLAKITEIRRSMPIQEHRKTAGPLFAQQMLEDTDV